MTWADVVAHPALQDLPFKIEQDRYGRILMSPPPRVQHSRLQGRLLRLLEEHLEEEAIPETPIATSEGTKVPDVAWMPSELADRYSDELVFPVAPPICVEVLSPSNTDEEMEEKVMLYLAKGAQEVWICDLEGAMAFYGHEGLIERSRLAPDFPDQI